MWGTHWYDEEASKKHRFIPTYVGNTNSGRLRATHSTVHPHVCGEHEQSKSPSRLISGSSPRMWGTPAISIEQLAEERFIPTYVGNTTKNGTSLQIITVHPHVCGEHVFIVFIRRFNLGSSPRMWGTLTSQTMRMDGQRFIPTYVGNTTPMKLPVSIITVHPHVCGEHSNCRYMFLKNKSRLLGATGYLMLFFGLDRKELNQP